MSKLMIKGEEIIGTKEESIIVLNTQAEYDALTDDEKTNHSYLIKNANATTPNASQIAYDSSNSVKDKIDATNTSLMTLNSNMIVQSEEITLTTDVNANAILVDNSRFNKNTVINIVSVQDSCYVVPLWGWNDSYYGVHAYYADGNQIGNTTIKVKVIYFANK